MFYRSFPFTMHAGICTLDGLANYSQGIKFGTYIIWILKTFYLSNIIHSVKQSHLRIIYRPGNIQDVPLNVYKINNNSDSTVELYWTFPATNSLSRNHSLSNFFRNKSINGKSRGDFLTNWGKNGVVVLSEGSMKLKLEIF